MGGVADEGYFESFIPSQIGYIDRDGKVCPFPLAVLILASQCMHAVIERPIGGGKLRRQVSQLVILAFT